MKCHREEKSQQIERIRLDSEIYTLMDFGLKQTTTTAAKGLFTRYDFAAYDKLTTSLGHVLGPFTRQRHFHLQN